MSNLIHNTLKKLPSQAGIYQFFNNEGKIIYIGKSVNLKSRVNSYFNGKSKLNFAKQKMVEQIADIKCILVENETESLILETNLIKQHLPKYNILMKDGKNHNYIKITDEEWPKIIKTRQKSPLSPSLSPHGRKGKSLNNSFSLGGKDAGKADRGIKEIYYGPYISSQDVDNILKILKKVYGYGVGKHNFFKKDNSYNLDKYLFDGNIKNLSEEEIKKIYFEKLDKIRYFLKGNYKEILEQLREEMMNFAQNHEFERADIIKKQIESIQILNEKQIVREGILGDYDIINFVDKYDKFYIGKIQIRDSKIIANYNYEIDNQLKEDNKEILKRFIIEQNLSNILANQEKKLPIIISPIKIDFKEELFKNIRIETPKKGTKLDLLKMAYKNIYEYAHKKHLDSLSAKSFTKQTMKNLLELLGFEQINKNIVFECNDISHLSGSHTVASRSVIENGKTNPSKYRKFKIKNLKQGEINDFDSMREIAKRRLQELEKLKNYPDLIIIDGGKPQLSSVYEVFDKIPLSQTFPQREKGVKKIQLVGIAKKEEILYKIEPPLNPLLTKKEKETESFRGGFKEYKLDKNSQELRLIQKIRDEAHRFAITFNRDSRIKTSKKNILESLPGIGPKTRKKILKEFGNIDNLAKSKKEDLKKILNKTQIETLENHGII